MSGKNRSADAFGPLLGYAILVVSDFDTLNFSGEWYRRRHGDCGAQYYQL